MAILKDAEGNDVEILTKEETTQMVTGAVSQQLKRELPKLATDVTSQVTKAIGDKVTESTAALLTEWEEKQKANPPAPPPGDPPKPPQVNVADSPEFKAMQKQVAESRQLADQLKAERDAERKRGRDHKLREGVTTQLTAIGLSDAQRARHALSFLVDGAKRISFESEDSDRLLYTNENNETLPLADGLKEWAQSEEAKIYLPPRGAGGSGGQAGASGPRGAAKTNEDQAAEMLAQHLFGGGAPPTG